jgi:5-(carboxyamino)imidazole ribonucleotide mutase
MLWFTKCKDKKITANDHELYKFAQKRIQLYTLDMKPKVSIIMGSTSDLSIMEAAAKLLDEFEIPFEINALSAHRTPEKVETFAKSARERGIQVIIAGAGMAAHLPGVIAAMTPLPVIGVPIKASLDGMDSLLSIVQMPPGIPVATMGINGARNAAIFAAQIMATADDKLAQKVVTFKTELKDKIVKANEELAKIQFKFKTN